MSFFDVLLLIFSLFFVNMLAVHVIIDIIFTLCSSLKLLKLSTKYLMVSSAFNLLKILLLLYTLAYYVCFMFINVFAE